MMAERIVELAHEAGRAIMAHYGRQHVDVTDKPDGSPLTAADMAAHRIIAAGLREHYPGIPVISEESARHSLDEGAHTFWLVDPLDGTREFIGRNGEFTVNIALIEQDVPVLGVVHAPALGRTYLGQRDVGAWRLSLPIVPGHQRRGAAARVSIHVEKPSSTLRVAVCRSHADARTAGVLKRIPRHELVAMGSSLKFCMIAEGRADFYPRLGTTMEWDTAAAQCVLEAAGGRVVQSGGEPLRYRKPAWRNPHFFAIGAAAPVYGALFQPAQANGGYA